MRFQNHFEVRSERAGAHGKFTVQSAEKVGGVGNRIGVLPLVGRDFSQPNFHVLAELDVLLQWQGRMFHLPFKESSFSLLIEHSHARSDS